MKMKTFVSIFAAFLALTLFVSAVSALSFSTPDNNHPLNALSQNHSTVTLVLTNDGSSSETVSLSMPNIVSGSNTVTTSVSPSSSFTLASGATQTVTVSGSSFSDFPFGSYSANLLASGSSTNATQAISHFASFCSNGPTSNAEKIIEITDVKIDNRGDSDGDDEEWYPFDEIEITVEVENVANDRDLEADDVIIEIGLLDSSGNNVIDQFEFDSSDEEQAEVGNLDEDDKEEYTFTITLEEVDEDLEGSFDLVIKAYEDGNEDEFCVDYADDLSDDSGFSQRITLERESDEGKFIRFSDIEVSPSQLTCGDSVSISTDVVNVGDEDQEQVEVRLFNTQLDLDLRQTIRSDLDSGDTQQMTFNFVVPQDAQDKRYDLSFIALYDYDEDDDEYDESSDDETLVSLNVIGCDLSPGSTGNIASISASLESEAVAGSQMTVRSTIENTAGTQKTYAIRAIGYESWASLDSVSDRILSLNPGQSEDVLLTFTPNEDVSGQRAFTISAESGSESSTRDVIVSISPKAATGLSGLFGSGNTWIWTIGIINVVLIILIIIVAISLARR